MRAITTFVSLTLSLGTLLAQTEKGRGLWSGGIGGQLTTTEKYLERGRDASVQVFINKGCFVRQSVLLGMEVAASGSTLHNEVGIGYDTKNEKLAFTSTVSPYIRRYWGRQNWRVYLGGGLLFGYDRAKTQSLSTANRVTQQREHRLRLSPEVQAGFVYFVNDRWGVEATTRSTAFPLTISNLGVGVVMVTGGRLPARPLKVLPTQNQVLATNWILAGGFVLNDNLRQLIPSESKAEVFRQEVSRGVSVSPSIGYLIADRLIIGVAAPFSYNILTDAYVNTPGQAQVRVERRTAGVQPFVKKYFTTQKLTPYAGLQASWQWQEDGTTTDTYGLTFSAGLAYMIGTRFILEGELGRIGGGWSKTRDGEIRQHFGDIRATLRPGFSLSYAFL
ncbi:hypothetical protein GCM10023187_08990 [Nibrella viscosa]|uniref:Outer membrane protein beta-barrel domain-containing protein n=1 Tax=Nibrella viscosa TaxID=1084524 RepID=A0ABP8JZ70_9BACT